MRVLRIERRGSLAGGLIGYLTEGDRWLAYTLERAWKDNQADVSCVPCGDYPCKFEHSARFDRKLYELKGVPGRSECKFHVANYVHQLQGCIGLGLTLGSATMPIRQSTPAIDRLHGSMQGEGFMLEVRMSDSYIPESHRLGVI
jgi:hypothetical protein